MKIRRQVIGEEMCICGGDVCAGVVVKEEETLEIFGSSTAHAQNLNILYTACDYFTIHFYPQLVR